MLTQESAVSVETSDPPLDRPADGLLSIVICCHNRAVDALEGVAALIPQVKALGGRLLVIDSASDLQNSSLLKDAELDKAGVTLGRLDRPGLSVARNAAISQTTSEWVAFIDDDALPEPNWLAAILEVLQNIPETCGAIGGRILPIYPAGSFPDLGPRWKMYLSLNEQTGSRDCTDRFELIAANCCFRVSALKAVGGFPEGLGRVGDELLSGEDVMLMTRLRERGWRIRYESRFSVGHKIPTTRLTPRWVHARAYWEGITTVRMARLLGGKFRRRRLLKAMLALPILAVLSAFDEPRREWRIRYWYDLGVIVEDFRVNPRRFTPKS